MSIFSGGVLRFIFTFFILLSGMSMAAFGQDREWDLGEERYGGIEIGHEGLAIVVLRVTRKAGEADIKLAHSNVVRLPLWRRVDGTFAPQAATDAAQAVSAALKELQQEHRVRREHIYLIGSSRLAEDHPANLLTTIKEITGLNLRFLDEISEVQLRIAGVVPKVGKDGNIIIDSRNTSALFHIGSVSSQGGYELMRYPPMGQPTVDYVEMNVPYGVVTYTNEIIQAVGAGANQYAFAREVKASGAIKFRQALRKWVERYPGMMYRKTVFLTGNLAWAMATLMYPEERQGYVTITYASIGEFAEKMARSPKELVFRDFSFIRDRGVRQQVRQEIEDIKATFTPQQLIAGAEMLKVAAEELKWQDKKVVFVRFGNLGSILSYVRLQIPQ